MSAASDYTEQNVINALLRGIAFPLPSHTYVSLHTGDPTDAGGSEVDTANWPGYVRKQAEAGGAIGNGWSAPSNGVSTNSNTLSYPANNGAGTITVSHWAVYDAATGGNMLAHAPLQTPRDIGVGDVFVFDAGSLTVTMA